MSPVAVKRVTAAGIALLAAIDIVLRAYGIYMHGDGWWAFPVAVLGVAALGFMAQRRQRWPAVFGLVVLCALGWRADILDGGPHRSFYASGVALLGWCIGRLWPYGDEAELGAAAALAATYFSAGLSKLAVGGLDWALEARTLRAMLLTVRAVGLHTGILDRAANMVIETPAVARALAVGTLIVQLGAPLWLCGRVMRVVWGMMFLGFHFSVLALSGIGYSEQVMLVILLSVPSLFRQSLAEPGWDGVGQMRR